MENNIKTDLSLKDNPIRPQAYKILKIEKHTQIEWTFRIEFEKEMVPGQFLELSLPRIGEAPISVSGFGDNFVELTIRNVGEVTKEIFEKKVGDYIFARGPYGNGWPIEDLKGKNIIVVAGGTGLSPVRGLIEYIRKNPDDFKDLYLISGFKNHNSVLFKEDLEKWKNTEKFHTRYTLDTEEYQGFKKGMVTEYVKEIPFKDFDENFACLMVGPPVMIRFTALAFLKEGVKDEQIWTSFERRMSCGVGKCGHCRINDTYVCLDGPVFNYTKAKELLD
ncbi:MAG: anaerobic sulfite reductase subunit AsrB [Peptoniphilaceae bacterium]|nr:anaerobic sulfite reductase subunit AsrB [Peptoniphilaceae bacterium]MDY6019291.1 anaerobic sulfite reductase subunit AsrB [Anaerococcus sp.]